MYICYCITIILMSNHTYLCVLIPSPFIYDPIVCHLPFHLGYGFTYSRNKLCAFCDLYNHNHSQIIADDLGLSVSVCLPLCQYL